MTCCTRSCFIHNQMAAFLHCHGHTRAQIPRIVIKHRALIEMIGKRMPCNINCNVTSHKTANFCIPAEQLCLLHIASHQTGATRDYFTLRFYERLPRFSSLARMLATNDAHRRTYHFVLCMHANRVVLHCMVRAE